MSGILADGLFRISLDLQPSLDAVRCLSAEELARAASFTEPRDRRRYLAAHVALRGTLAKYVGVAPERLLFERHRFGKPFLCFPAGSCAFSLSHSQDIAAIAVTRRGEIGVDIEALRGIPDALSLAARHFSASEQDEVRGFAGPARDTAFLTCWTRKEACLKAIGCGLSIAPRIVDVGTSRERRRVSVPGAAGPFELVVESSSEREGSIVSVALLVSDAPHAG